MKKFIIMRRFNANLLYLKVAFKRWTKATLYFQMTARSFIETDHSFWEFQGASHSLLYCRCVFVNTNSIYISVFCYLKLFIKENTFSMPMYFFKCRFQMLFSTGNASLECQMINKSSYFSHGSDNLTSLHWLSIYSCWYQFYLH